MITLEGIDHVVLRTTKLPDMLHFYCQVLGAQLERELPAEMGLVQLRAGSALIDLVNVDSQLGRLGGKPPSQNGRNLDHFCLQIAPVAEGDLLEYLSQNNIACEGLAERYGAEGFGRSLYIHDPEGNVVELKSKV
ncbi:VOC family protein [Photobacterium lutimaris]|uniref:VOC family virulence protein n=1 Tax=Photobacterium lutimaris TaxID=388278 RepID=A0A2T3IXY0_9GAMM|nr:VOC family protein [Photobacterium lutimaris]PSU33394.1 VOC family virulence protein [Photobacterium lutimaris]TDR75006.1 glyoxalase/bleomycin resistance protein/dioxygenase superfamily protein [Photobacterium lutimaris]